MGDEQGYVREKDDPAERLLALTLVLLSSDRGLTKEELYRSIRGYSMAIESGASIQAVEKKFDRDKDDLRDCGINIDVDNTEPENPRYVIRREAYVWPKGTSLSSAQLKLLNLASQVWALASLSGQAKHAITKLKALGTGGDSAELIGYAPRIRTHEPAFLPISAAQAQKTVVSFDYRKAGTEAIETRTLSAWQLINLEGQWLVLGWDHDRSESRHFMLKRIVSKIRAIEKDDVIAFVSPSAADLAEAEASLNEHTAAQVAVIEIDRDSEAWFRYELDRPGVATDGRLTINFTDLHLFAEELREYGASVRVISPKSLAEAVREGFEKVVDAHA
ncbi:MAG: hypothetical protein RLZZ626_918 [Actinomycetota bacterium]|jgi:proteasome accessory factor B